MFRVALLASLAAVITFKVMNSVIKSGAYSHYKKHYPGPCRSVKGLNFGSEDLEVTKDGLAFVTSGISFPTLSASYQDFLRTNDVQGRIYLFDFNKPQLEARELALEPTRDFNPDTFHPHGISLVEDHVTGEHLVYVVNHPDNGDDAVEKFRFLPTKNKLLHLKSFRSPQLRITNDLAVTEEDQFYITNFLYFKEATLSFIEQGLLPVGLGSVLFFNGSDFSVVVSGLHAPNGMVLSRDKRYLYMNLPPENIVHVYERKWDNTLVLQQSVQLHSFPDNLHLSEAGDALYTGAHPILHLLLEHLHDPRLRAPSSVLRLPLKNGRIVTENITELFYDHGDLISGSSSAAVYKKKLLIGSVINKLVICDVNANVS